MKALLPHENTFDVIIIGAGPSGLMLSTWMARLGVKTLLLDANHEPVQRGHADGLDPRTFEILDSFDMADSICKVANPTLEMGIWTADKDGKLHRKRRLRNCASKVSHFGEATCGQAVIESTLLQGLEPYENVMIYRGVHPKNLHVSPSDQDNHSHPIQLSIETANSKHQHNLRSKYVVGCDGAHSWTRHHLQIPYEGELGGSYWGVLDVVPVTDFRKPHTKCSRKVTLAETLPADIRIRCMISSISGNVMIIPREYGLVRFYIQLNTDPAVPFNKADVTCDKIAGIARKILYPYTLNFTRCDWWTCYEVGRHLAASFSKHSRVLLCGDAAHSWSPKGGQGMNTGMQDAYNLGWKLAAVVHGTAKPELLMSYDSERRPVAQRQLNFDAKFSKFFIEPLRDSSEDTNGSLRLADFTKAIDEEHNEAASITVNYAQLSTDGWVGTCDIQSEKRTGNLILGQRIADGVVACHSDGRPWRLHNLLPSIGTWHLVIFAGDVALPQQMERVKLVCSRLESNIHGLLHFTVDETRSRELVRLTTIHSSRRSTVELLDFPSTLYRALVPMDGINYSRIFADEDSCGDNYGGLYKSLGIDTQFGSLALLRPDQHVAFIGALEDIEPVEHMLAKWYHLG